MAKQPALRRIALAGNPNVGKSTVFNALTGMHQHTGNWTGKTVATAEGRVVHGTETYCLVDLPGTYSLLALSPEEAVARDSLFFDAPDAVIVVVDATALQRSLNLALQVLEMCPAAVVCVNLLDEAEKKNVHVDIAQLAARLGVPVVGCTARKRRGLTALMDAVARRCSVPGKAYRIEYAAPVEAAIAQLLPAVQNCGVPPRWAALKMLAGEGGLYEELLHRAGKTSEQRVELVQKIMHLRAALPGDTLRDAVAEGLNTCAAQLCAQCLSVRISRAEQRERKLDKLLTSRTVGIPLMLLGLAGILWLTVQGANYPSQWLSAVFARVEQLLRWGAMQISLAPFWQGLLIDGAYHTLAWVVAVMLPPMAIFFPLFTLLEDAGLLPRVAFNMDALFCRCGAHGKQALTTCMGLGCNACGVMGCRIIDSPRERLIAILTNSFAPCNGRFPTLIALISIFFAGAGTPLAALMLLGALAIGMGATLLAAKLLSATVLKGVSSRFVLEMPPYRRPQWGRVLVRSVLDRTVFVLGRAAAVALPAGALLWLLANITVGDAALLAHCTRALERLGRVLGMDGTVLAAFILGLPANEIVLPVALMAYSAQGTLTGYTTLAQLGQVLTANGWTWLTALCTALFCIMHFPCATTCWTIYKETRSIKWTALAVLLPTAMGMVCCAAVAAAVRFLGI